MTQQNLKLSYVASSMSVNLVMSLDVCHGNTEAMNDLLQRARQKMNAEQEKQTVAGFVVFEELLKKVWAKGQELDAATAQNTSVQVCLAQGFPQQIPIQFLNPGDPKILATLQVDTVPADFNTWQWDWFEACFLSEQARQQQSGEAISGQLRHLFLQLRAHGQVKQFTLFRKPLLENSSQGYRIIANRKAKEVLLFVTDAKWFAPDGNLETFVNQVGDAINALATSHGAQYGFRRKDLHAELSRIKKGPESVGIGLPLGLLAAIERDPAKAAPSSGPSLSARLKVPAAKAVSAKPLLNFEISEDKMQVILQEIPVEVMSRPDINFSPEWIKAELSKAKVVHGFDEKNIAEAVIMIKEKQNVISKIVAVGEQPKLAVDPFLHATFLDRRPILDTERVINLRDAQNLQIVGPGEVVAEIRYRQAAVAGTTVFGEKVPAPAPDIGNIAAGDGVERRDDGKYYSTIQGMPKVEGTQVWVEKAYIHTGDVNLKSGNIYFDGPVLIQGSIDGGATVVAGGDLTVMGVIGAAYVRTKGQLQALQGINTGGKGVIYASAGLTADFIDNSKVICQDNMVVSKSILNSDIVCGGQVEVRGILAGGSISTFNDLVVDKLGFARGAKTLCLIGVDWRIQQRLNISKGRIVKAERAMELAKAQFNDLKTRISRNAMIENAQEKFEAAKERIARLKNICFKLEVIIRHNEKSMNWNKEAMVKVRDIIVPNVVVEIGGKGIHVPGELKAILISSKKVRGEHIQAWDGGAGDGQPKAS